MAEKKQVMDVRPNKDGISKQESNEQQRNWSENLWDRKSKDSLANYDPTRAQLNFEVTKGGKVQPIDKSKSIDERMIDILNSRGIKNPNARAKARRKQRILAQMIFGGSRERMLELAFGKQVVNLNKGADNSKLTRNKDIETWAADVYGFVARKFGEENIVSFYVHLDETNPHCHCTVLPIDEMNHRISWTSVFGKNPMEEKATFTRLHNELYEEVNSHWGLERGSNKAETGARHRSTEEYKRDLINQVQELECTRERLQRQIRRAEIKLKGLSTMIANLQTRKEKINEEIELIAQQLGEDGQDKEQLANRMEELRKQMEDIDQKMADKQRMLDEAESELSNAITEFEKLKQAHSKMSKFIGDDIDRRAEIVHSNINATYYKMMASSMEPLLPTLNAEQHEILDKSGFFDLRNNSQHIINCALLLAINYISQATTYAESCGGGGSGNMSGWGRDKEDDDERWWMRCILQAAAMVRPAGRKIKRSR